MSIRSFFQIIHKTLVFVILFYASSNIANAHGEKQTMRESAIKHAFILPPNSNHEECFFLMKGKTLVYEFNAPKLLEFNIHYHSNNRLYYPVFPEILNSVKNFLAIRSAEEYCLMWKNRKDVSVKFKYKIQTENSSLFGQE